MFEDPARQLYRADIVALPVMGAAFRDQHAVAVLETVDRTCALNKLGKVAFIAREKYRKGSERHIARRIARDTLERLRVGDDKAGLVLYFTLFSNR